MAFAQPTCRESLRDIETCLHAQSSLADAILDPPVHTARITLRGESLRKRHACLTPSTPAE
jgi:hypothetical protein